MSFFDGLGKLTKEKARASAKRMLAANLADDIRTEPKTKQMFETVTKTNFTLNQNNSGWKIVLPGSATEFSGFKSKEDAEIFLTALNIIDQRGLDWQIIKRV